MKKKTILQLYNEYEMRKKNSEKYDRLLRKFNILRGEFDNNIVRNQRKELESLLSLVKTMSSIESEEYFIEGFSIGVKLMTEVFYKEQNV